MLRIFHSGKDFNSRPSARGDTRGNLHRVHLQAISIHAPPRGATGRRRKEYRRFNHFNSRPSARGDGTMHVVRALRSNFNSRPSARGDHDAHRRGLVGTISIHAPPRGATIATLRRTPLLRHFNSRPSARGDRWRTFSQSARTISIHAPPRGATRREKRDSLKRMAISIHAPPRGATSALGVTGTARPFQFTPLREGRPHRGGFNPDALYFNSRPSARGDGKRYAISANLLFNPYKSAWLNNSATQFVEIILVIFHRIIA